MSEDYSYFLEITDRERINDLVHKIAKGRGIPYPKAWSVFARAFKAKHDVDLFEARSGKQTLVDAVMGVGMQQEAIALLHGLTDHQVLKGLAEQQKNPEA